MYHPIINTVLIATFVLFPLETIGKTRVVQQDNQIVSRVTTTTSARTLELNLRPYLEAKLSHSLGQMKHLPRETDFLLLARYWNRLSPQFKKLYQEATAIPDDFNQFISPSNHFEVYYTKFGPSKVDSTDTIGYGKSGNWRTRVSGKNGTPDYVDEVAWALDSAWSMEVDQYKYNAPLPSKDPLHSSDRYKVVITTQGPSFYGRTYVEAKKSQDSIGYASHIEINNDWSDPDWKSLGYNDHPENGARVTCAHEFFHAIQYAMSWNVRSDIELDDFPLSWLEGTAVLMEELAFDSINDYMQYVDVFFSQPQFSFFSTAQDNSVYVNGIITKFLHEFYNVSFYDDFIRRTTFNNYNQALQFGAGLQLTSGSYGLTWVQVLNDFNARSYFTGSRARDGMFVADAHFFDEWQFSLVALDQANTSKKRVGPFGMEIFYFKPEASHDDTLHIAFNGSLTHDDSSSINPTWAASCIIRSHNSGDSIIPLQIGKSTGTIDIPNWKLSDGVVMVVTNGNDSMIRDASVCFQPCPVAYKAGQTYTFDASNEAAGSTLSLELSAISDLRCPISLASTPDTIGSKYLNDSLRTYSGLYEILFPSSWTSNAANCSLYANLSVPCTDSQATIWSKQSTSNFGIYVYDKSTRKWSNIPKSFSKSSEYATWKFPVTKAGFYTIASLKTPTLGNTLLVFQKPFDNNLYFTAKDITSITVYSIDGTNVNTMNTQGSFPRSFSKQFNSISWNRTNRNGIKVVPGLYIVNVVTDDLQTGLQRNYKRKLLITP